MLRRERIGCTHKRFFKRCGHSIVGAAGRSPLYVFALSKWRQHQAEAAARNAREPIREPGLSKASVSVDAHPVSW
jgi:hypothetical protein